MLDEKDRMLGAIGHDMRTPLASLRIRAESVEPAAEREKMIATIEEMTAMLDDTLALARSGRATEEVRPSTSARWPTPWSRSSARSASRDVRAARARSPRSSPTCCAGRCATWSTRRSNMAAAEVAVRAGERKVAIEIADQGPGIPEAELGNVQEPFVRLETSRNRETGGSGLGLALARGAAQAHGGSLELENRPEGGLLARILLPARMARKA